MLLKQIMKKIFLIFTTTLLFLQLPLSAQEWQALNPCCGNDIIRTIFPVDSITILMATDGNLHKTYDQGENWEMVFEGVLSINHINDISRNKNGRIYAVFDKFDNNNGGLLFSDDEGESWTELNLPNSKTPHSVYFLNNEVGFVGCSDARLMKTVDGGLSWKTVLKKTYSNFESITFIDSLNGFAVGGRVNQSLSFKTTDGGETWTSAGITGSHKRRIQFPTPTVGYVTTNYSISKTIDGGNTWFNIDAPDALYYDHIHFLTDSIGYLITHHYVDASGGWYSESRIFKTEDGGMTWVQEFTKLDLIYGLIDMEFYNEYGFIAGDRGGFYTTTADPIISHTKNKLNEKITTYIVPNPAHAIIKLENIFDFKYQLYNFSGQLIQYGETNEFINIRQLLNGVYFIKAEKDDMIISLKFIKQ